MNKTQEQRAFDILSYYRVSSEITGRDYSNKDESKRKEQAGFSIHWFYKSFFPGDGSFDSFHDQKILESLTPQLRAFLIGEGEERERLFSAQQGNPIEIEDRWLLENEKGLKLNASQKSALEHALNGPISLIQGPPGTGKTETILNMISCILSQPENKTVAVVANNGEAINNIIDKINEHRNCNPNTMPNWQRLCRSFARLGKNDDRKMWCKEHPEEAKRFVFVDKENGNKSSVKAEEFLQEHPFIMSTAHSLAKCFRNGASYRYDYVIMDEASQCDIMLGLIPMNLTKHLVLVGDTKQLAPVFKDHLQPEIDQASEAERIEAPRDDALALSVTTATDTKEGNSILAAMEHIAGEDQKVLLNEHYRCHPGIIEYCNQKFYDGKLVIKTDGDKSRPPIRVRWFAGSYAEAGEPPEQEKSEKSPSVKTSRRNMRQIEVFMTEEWPLLKQQLKEEHPPSFCVLSPFRGQIKELNDALGEVWDSSEFELATGETDEYAQTNPINGFMLCAKPKKSSANSDKKSVEKEIEKHTTTIHKSQGSEFDIVYLLPVDDLNWEWPWSQGDRLINVAVSRAKKELVVILSSGIMSEKTQRALSEAKLLNDKCLVTARTKKKEVEENANYGDDSAASKKTDDTRSDNFLYVEQLVDYVANCGADYYPQSIGDWGFFRSGFVSIFDEVPRRRQEAGKKKKSSANISPATEEAFCQTLRTINLSERGLVARRNVRLKDLNPQTSWESILSDRNAGETNCKDAKGPITETDRRAFIECNIGDDEDGSHFDFAILDEKTGQLVMAIEIDGEEHRTLSHFKKRKKGITEEEEARRRLNDYYTREKNDRMKDDIVIRLGGRVLPNNKRSTCAIGPTDASFTLLRLPTDGTTAWETESLVRKITSGVRDDCLTAIRDSFITIEELLDKQLKHGFDQAPRVSADAGTVVESLSISMLLRKLREEDPDFLPEIAAAGANAILATAGLIRHEDSDWLVTDAGKAAGIEQAQHLNDNGTFNQYCRYPPHCHDLIKKKLSEYA